MAGGIQKGTEAGSVESKKLDGDVKVIAEAIAQAQSLYFYESGHRSLDERKFNYNTVIEAALPEMRDKKIRLGCMPDGGMWFDGPRNQPRTLKVAFEAKHQQDGGNAIERWAKNFSMCHKLWPESKYVTFMTGEGAEVGGVLHDFGETYSELFGSNCIFYYGPNGFSQQDIFNIMSNILGLNLTFEDIKPFINRKVAKNTYAHFFVEETEEERLERLAAGAERHRQELAFSKFSQDPSDPLYPVWHRLPREDKSEAHEIVIEMLSEGKANAVIATELVECFLSK